MKLLIPVRDKHSENHTLYRDAHPRLGHMREYAPLPIQTQIYFYSKATVQ